MQSAAGPPGGSNPKRATGRSHRSADGASPAALDRSPREVARPAHAHGLASTATFGGAICAFIALWILLAPIELLPTVGGAHSVHFESDSLFGRHALRQKVAAGCPRRAAYRRLARQPLPLDQPNFDTVIILSLRARGELWRRSKLAQIR